MTRTLRSRACAAVVAVGLASGLVATLTTSPATASTGGDVLFRNYVPGNVDATYHYFPSGRTGSGLVVYLDGDGQWGHLNPWSSHALDHDQDGGAGGIVAQARARGLDVMSVHTPAADKTWWTDCAANEKALTALLEKVMTERGVNRSDLWITGYSGGAQFTTRCFLPRHADMIRGGGTVVFGGGGTPQGEVEPFTAAMKAGLDLHWITGTHDIPEHSPGERYDGYGQARKGYQYYTDAGFRTYATWPVGVDHDEIGGQFGTYIGRAIDRSRAVRPVPTPTPSPKPTTSPTPAPWATTVRAGRDHLDITVNIPAGTSTTRVRIDGPGGSYWYEDVTGSGTKTVRMGDPGDMLTPGTTYTYKVVSGGQTRASGSATTLR